MINFIPWIRRHRLHQAMLVLDSDYYAKHQELRKFQGLLFKWSIESFFKCNSLLTTTCSVALVIILKANLAFILLYPTIVIISCIVASIWGYNDKRKELGL